MTNLAPAVIAVDDLHWLDAESARFAAYLAQRLEGTRVLLAAGFEPPTCGLKVVAWAVDLALWSQIHGV